MKIYTKTGDKGETSLLGGIRVSKSDMKIQLLGQVDKLNSCIGLNISHLDEIKVPKERLLKQAKLLRQIQNLLFEIGSKIAKPENEKFDLNSRKELDLIIQEVEIQIDEMTSQLNELKNFILPGGSKSASFAHLTRTIIRETEIQFIVHKESFDIIEFRVFLNRLSDYFFTLARYLNKLENIEDVIWHNKIKD